MAQKGFFINESMCQNCHACEIACSEWNDIRPTEYSDEAVDVKWLDILTREEGSYDDLDLTTLPLPCLHCEEPACVEAAPENGIYKREEDGLVFVEPSNLSEGDTEAIVEACPFDRIQVSDIEMPASSSYPDGKLAGLPQKCTGCFDRVEEPACVAACPTEALQFGDIETLRDEHPDASQELLKEIFGTQAVENNKPAIIIEE